MSESKAIILGCAGKSLSSEEESFYRDERPWGFILFARNIGEPAEIADLVAALRDCVGRPDAPVFIDQEGGRVQRLRPPIAPNYPSGAALGALYREDRDAGLRAAWLMARLHAFDLLRFGINADCLPVLDVPIEGASDVIGTRAYGKDPETVTALGRAVGGGADCGRRAAGDEAHARTWPRLFRHAFRAADARHAARANCAGTISRRSRRWTICRWR